MCFFPDQMISEGCVNNEKKAIVKCIYGGRWYTYNMRNVVCVCARVCMRVCVFGASQCRWLWLSRSLPKVSPVQSAG